MGTVWQVMWFALTGIHFSLGDKQMLFWDACTLAAYQLLRFLLLQNINSVDCTKEAGHWLSAEVKMEAALS